MDLQKLKMIELSTHEMMSVRGGGEIAYWLGYAMGYASGKIEQAKEWLEETMRD
ncbi:hypothetical protein [Flavobacterium cerinum]|uniref:Bacteriocin n=1 Tax=Flavobacterium cerinum TaxID=2502784 RepID=A0ABY5IYK3_9FLAO|nr:hypothetical protein [Flavobacterium cerinum]UUC46414.1 hypothetical protein NOX80_04230 [Flavobacterium cerinum]